MGAAAATLVRSVWATQPQSLRPIPWPAKKKKENRTRARQTKAVGAGLEDFVDWTGIIASEPTRKRKYLALPFGLPHGCVSGLRAQALRVRPPLDMMGNNRSGLL